jgi:transposase
LILDKGNSSKDNQQHLHASSFHFVTALTASDHADLLAIPRTAYAPMWTEEPRLGGVSAYRTQKELWGRSYTVVLTFSESFYEKQLTSLERQIQKTQAHLQAYWAKVQRWHSPHRPRGRAPTPAGVEKQVAQILAPQYMKTLFPITVTQQDGLPTFAYRFDAAFLEHLKEHRLGKTFLVTDQEAWSTLQIILAYRAQAHIEDAFKIMKDPHWVCVWPFFHWTDQNLKVHTFCCVLALTLTSLLYRTVRHAGLTLSFQEMMHQLQEIHQVLILSEIPDGSKQHRVKLDLVLSPMDPIQQRLYDLLNLATYAAP